MDSSIHSLGSLTSDAIDNVYINVNVLSGKTTTPVQIMNDII